MIVVKLMGGLGNQMFQYAAARQLADLRGTELTLDLSAFERPPRGQTARSYELDCFHVRASLSRTPVVASTPWQRARQLRRGPRRVVESGFPFEPAVLAAPADCHLLGYWQSERYFEAVAETIREDFRFRSPLGEARRAIAERLDPGSVSVHVRRGDYVSDPRIGARHGLLSAEYYRRAAARIGESVEAPHFMVISDDPEWCRAQLALGYPTTVVDSLPRSGCEDLQLMSLCAQHLIANSSFGWWGAWLGRNPEKTVIAPERWFATDELDTRDLYPPGWVRLA